MRRFTGTELLVATHNQGKLEEIAHLLEPFGITVTSAREHGLPEPEETGTTFVENARIKAHAAAKATGLPALSDDSGIEIDALGRRARGLHRRLGRNTEGRDFVMAMRRAMMRLNRKKCARAPDRTVLLHARPGLAGWA
jgi:XTP/dITP diphosphohydrolase